MLKTKNQCKDCGRLLSASVLHTCPESVWNKGTKGLQTAWNKGLQSSSKTKDKISSTRKERIKTGEIKKPIGKSNGMFGKIPWNKGKKLDYPSPKKGIKVSKEIREKISGERHYKWKGGINSLNRRIRNCYEYRQWVQDILKRDNYTCEVCFVLGGQLEVHHIKPFSVIIRENSITTVEEALACHILWNFENGQTLCKKCHKQTDSYLKHNL